MPVCLPMAANIRVRHTRAGSIRGDNTRPDSTRLDNIRPDNIRLDSIRLDSIRADSTRAVRILAGNTRGLRMGPNIRVQSMREQPLRAHGKRGHNSPAVGPGEPDRLETRRRAQPAPQRQACRVPNRAGIGTRI